MSWARFQIKPLEITEQTNQLNFKKEKFGLRSFPYSTYVHGSRGTVQRTTDKGKELISKVEEQADSDAGLFIGVQGSPDARYRWLESEVRRLNHSATTRFKNNSK